MQKRAITAADAGTTGRAVRCHTPPARASFGPKDVAIASTHLARSFLLAASLLSLGVLLGCTTTSPRAEGSSTEHRHQIDAGIDATLPRLYEAAPESRQLVAKAASVLVFPSVLGVSFGVGVEHGDGALRVGSKTAGYYTTTTGSALFSPTPV